MTIEDEVRLLVERLEREVTKIAHRHVLALFDPPTARKVRRQAARRKRDGSALHAPQKPRDSNARDDRDELNGSVPERQPALGAAKGASGKGMARNRSRGARRPRRIQATASRIVELLQASGPLSRRQIDQAVRLGPDVTGGILRKLVADKRIAVMGFGRAASYSRRGHGNEGNRSRTRAAVTSPSTDAASEANVSLTAAASTKPSPWTAEQLAAAGFARGLAEESDKNDNNAVVSGDSGVGDRQTAVPATFRGLESR